MGGKPDALIDGANCEITNKLTLQRRPGLVAFGPSIEPPLAFYEYRKAVQAVPGEAKLTGGATSNLQIVIDTESKLYNYSPTYAGLYLDKSVVADQTKVYNLVNTLYLGDGVDLYKIPGPNLLRYSNTWAPSNESISGTFWPDWNTTPGDLLALYPGASYPTAPPWPWSSANLFSVTVGQSDPNNQNYATAFVWNTTGSTAYIEQDVAVSPADASQTGINYTPVASNTFTFSVWMKATGGALSVDLEIKDQSGTIVDTTFALTSTWTKYQVTGTMGASSNIIKCLITNPTSTSTTMFLYGAQLEVGGPATPTQITYNTPQGVYLWGIIAPTVTPTTTFTPNTQFPAWQPDHLYNVGDKIIDSNGNIQQMYGYVPSGGGTPITTGSAMSGTITPVWMTQAGQQTEDGANEAVAQTFGGTSTSASLTINVPNPVVASDALFLWVFQSNASDGASHTNPTVSDSQGNPWTALTTAPFAYDTFAVSLFWVNSAAETTGLIITVSDGGSNGTYATGCEIGNQTGTINTKGAQTRSVGSTAPFFATGGVTTSYGNIGLLSFVCLINNQSGGAYLAVTPAGFQSATNAAGLTTKNTSGQTAYINLAIALEAVTTETSYSPTWGITNSNSTGNLAFGFTVALEGSGSYILWNNIEPAGVNPTTGYQYYYAFMSSLTGHVSNVSPIGVSTGAQTLQNIIVQGGLMPSQVGGDASHDPQVDLIALFRNTDGGPFFYLLTYFGNGTNNQTNLQSQATFQPDFPYTPFATLGTGVGQVSFPASPSNAWRYVDATPDVNLVTSIFAPLGLLNSPPPAGLTNMEFFEGRMFGSVDNLLYYNTAADNYSLLNETQNGVPAESWAGANVVIFDSIITRLVAVGGGLLVFTQTDIWVVTGTNILNGGFNPTRMFAGHGLLSYNALAKDGSTIWIYTSDREMLMMTPGSGSLEAGFPIGDVLEATFDPSLVYITRHVAGSQDNAVYLADGSTGWYRLNPNQQGASMSGEQTPVWSPKANITGGCGAIASIQTSPGVHQLLVGGTSTGPVLNRDLTIFNDNGTPFEWFATIGTIVLVNEGELAEVESITTKMNNSTGGNATQPRVGVLLDEISGAFEYLGTSVNDPPQFPPSKSLLSNRFYLKQGTVAPVCQNIQIQLEGSFSSIYDSTQDELLSLTIRGAKVPEQG